MRRNLLILLSFAIVALGIFALDLWHTERELRVSLYDVDGNNVGQVMLRSQLNDVVLITAHIWNMPAGFHGFHIHESGRCEVTDEGAFLTAGGHFDIGDHNHGEHSGDLPLLLISEKGSAYLSFRTSSFHLHDLISGDKTAFIIHAGADNYANIPARYGGADATTLANGDAGERIACGVIGGR